MSSHARCALVRTALEGQKAPRHGKHKKAICRFVDFVLFALWRVPSASAHACGAEGTEGEIDNCMLTLCRSLLPGAVLVV